MTAESLDDLVARLREKSSHEVFMGGSPSTATLMRLAATEIVALRTRAERVETLHASLMADADKRLDASQAEVVALRADAERYRWLMDVWDEACPFANGLPLWDYDSSMVSAAIDHERLAEKDKGG